MSTSDTPEIATRIGAIDSTALARGNAVDAHLLRNLIRNSNRLSAKGEHIAMFCWPRIGPTDNSDAFYRWVPTTHWTRLLPPVPIVYRRGLGTAEVRMHARVTGTHTVTMQIATKAAPFDMEANASSSNTLDLEGPGDDSVDSFSKTGLLIDPSGYDELDIRVKAEQTTDLADEGLGGANERADITSPIYTAGFLYDTSGSWWTATPSVDSFDHLGTQIAFDTTGSGYATRRLITSVGTRYLFWTPALSDSELTNVQSFDDFVLYQLPRLGLISLTIAAEGRSL